MKNYSEITVLIIYITPFTIKCFNLSCYTCSTIGPYNHKDPSVCLMLSSGKDGLRTAGVIHREVLYLQSHPRSPAVGGNNLPLMTRLKKSMYNVELHTSKVTQNICLYPKRNDPYHVLWSSTSLNLLVIWIQWRFTSLDFFKKPMAWNDLWNVHYHS